MRKKRPVHCPECGATVRGRFCSECGADLDPAPAASSSPDSALALPRETRHSGMPPLVIMIWIAVGLAFLALLARLVPIDAPPISSTMGASQQSSVSSNPASPPKSNTWKTVAKFQGNSTKNTETFRIAGDEWRISWDTKPGQYGDMNFAITVYKPGIQIPVGLAANVIGASTDSSVMRGKGDYYLGILTSQLYAIVVDARD